MRNLYENLVAQSSRENDFLGVSVNSDHFGKEAGGLSLRPIKDFSVKNIIEFVSEITQSNKNFVLDQSFNFEATYVDVPTGKGQRKRVTVNAATRRSMVSITNSDNLCLPRAILVGKT